MIKRLPGGSLAIYRDDAIRLADSEPWKNVIEQYIDLSPWYTRNRNRRCKASIDVVLHVNTGVNNSADINPQAAEESSFDLYAHTEESLRQTLIEKISRAIRDSSITLGGGQEIMFSRLELHAPGRKPLIILE